MLDFTWTPDVAAHLLACGSIQPRLWPGDPAFVEGRWGFFPDGWVRNTDGTAACRWRIEIRERETLFTLRRRLRLDPSRMGAARLLQAWRRLQAHQEWHWQRLTALTWKGDMFHPCAGTDVAWTYRREPDGVSGTTGFTVDTPLDNDAALAALVHARWQRVGETARRCRMVEWALLRIIAGQLPPPVPGAGPVDLRLAGESAIAEVVRTDEMNEPDRVLAWRVRFTPLHHVEVR